MCSSHLYGSLVGRNQIFTIWNKIPTRPRSTLSRGCGGSGERSEAHSCCPAVAVGEGTGPGLPCPSQGFAQGHIRLPAMAAPLPSLSAAEAPFLDALHVPLWASPPPPPSQPIFLLPAPRWPHCDQLSSVPHVHRHPVEMPRRPGGPEGPAGGVWRIRCSQALTWGS